MTKRLISRVLLVITLVLGVAGPAVVATQAAPASASDWRGDGRGVGSVRNARACQHDEIQYHNDRNEYWANTFVTHFSDGRHYWNAWLLSWSYSRGYHWVYKYSFSVDLCFSTFLHPY